MSTSTRTPRMSTERTIAWFREIAIAEAISWAGLLVGMLFKYVLTGDEVGVHVFGPIHGVIFLGYVAITLLTWYRLGWTKGVLALGLVASIPPFATYAFELWAKRTGRLEPPAA